MNTIIRNVFLNPEQVEKKVEMVIGYKVNNQANLKTEIQEYVVTEHISQNLEKVLEWIEQSMNGNLSETGAWVSGFTVPVNHLLRNTLVAPLIRIF